MKSIVKVCVLAALLAVAATVTGCGKGRALAPVSGKVTYQGKSLPYGRVMLQPQSGQPSTGDIQSDGTFQMVTPGEGTGASVGKNMVLIVCRERPSPEAKAKAAAARQETSPGRSLIPEKYSSYDTSGITVDVHPGSNEPLVMTLSGPLPNQ
jgi:hypothetical protein